MTAPRVYLAGPDVFLANADEHAARKKAICSRHNIVGVSPADVSLPETGGGAENAWAIARANEALMDDCDAIIANMTPFRGVGVDPGTAYEIGYMRGRGKPVFGYSNDGRIYAERVIGHFLPPDEVIIEIGPGALFDPLGRRIENFGLHENLMLSWAVHEGGSDMQVPAFSSDPSIEGLDPFEHAVAAAKASISRKEGVMNLSDNLPYQEWQACQNALSRYDTALVDLRKFGFGLITLLLGANGFLFTDLTLGTTPASPYVVIGIFFALLTLIFGLFKQDRAQEVFIRGAVLRAMALEKKLEPPLGLTGTVSKWSLACKTDTWGTALYFCFGVAALVLALAGLNGAKMSIAGLSPQLGELLKNPWFQVLVCIVSFAAWTFALVWEHNKAEGLRTSFETTLAEDRPGS